jgi:hypothetical protein
MPLYEYECPRCQRHEEIYCSMKDYGKSVPKCCNEKMQRYISSGAYVIGDIQPYRSMQTGEVIGGRKQHRDHLKQHGLIEVGNERLPPRKPVPMPDLVEDLRASIREVRRGRR